MRQFDCITMDTPNATLYRKTRIQQAKDWLQEHDNETITTASRIFKVSRTTLSSSIQKAPAPNYPHGGANRILTSNQEQSLDQFIRTYLSHGLLPTKGVTYN
jgi:hypothetical protein